MLITQMEKNILAIWNDIIVEFTFHLTWLVQSHQVLWLSHVSLTLHKKNIEFFWFNHITIKCDFSLKDILWNSTPITYVIWQSKTSYTHVWFTKVYGIDCLLSNTQCSYTSKEKLNLKCRLHFLLLNTSKVDWFFFEKLQFFNYYLDYFNYHWMPKINYQLLKNLPKKQPKFDCQINCTTDPSLIGWLSTAATSMGFNSQIITTEIVIKLFRSLKLWPNNFDCWNCVWRSSNFNCQNNDKWIHFRSPNIEGTNQVKKKSFHIRLDKRNHCVWMDVDMTTNTK